MDVLMPALKTAGAREAALVTYIAPNAMADERKSRERRVVGTTD
jgi:hypothetical protein